MSLLHLWALGALGLVAVPIILHLRRRDTSRRIAFPALRYLSRAEDARSRSLRASDLLLLALRVAALAALALAAAGPLVGSGGAADHDPSDVAIIIDNSASTARLSDERSYLDRLTALAELTLSAAGPRDRFWLLPTVGPPLATGTTAARALAALGQLEQSDGGAELAAAVARATALLPAEEGRAREVQLLSDLQATSAGGAPADAEPLASASRGGSLVLFIAGEAADENGAITSLELAAGPSAPAGVQQTAAVGIDRFPSPGDGDTAAVSLRLELDGRTAGGTLSRWGAVAGLRLSDLPPGSHSGRVDMEPSGLRSDDARYFGLQVIDPPAVSHRGPTDSFTAFALSTLDAAGRISLGAEGIEVVETPGAIGPGPGSLILFPPADPVELPRFNQFLESRGGGWTLRPDSVSGSLGFGPDAADVPGLVDVRVHRRYLLRSRGPAADSVLLRTDDGEPWALRGRTSDGRFFILVGSPIEPEATDLPVTPAMIPFFEAALLRWSDLEVWPSGDFLAGRPIALPAWADSLRPPDGEPGAIEGGANWVPMRAGIYELLGRSADGSTRRAAHFAVNVPASESDLAPMSESRLQELFRGREVIMAGPDVGAWQDSIFRRRRGRDAAPWLLVAVLLLAISEIVLATPGRSATSKREFQAH